MASDFVFSDLNPNFTRDIRDDVSVRYDEDAIRSSIENIIMTAPYERVMNPDFGVGVRDMLFEQMDFKSAFYLKRVLQNNIDAYEPRVEVLEVVVRPDYDRHGYDVAIVLQIKGTGRREVIKYFLTQIR